MVRVGEDQGILTLKHLQRHFRSITRTMLSITTEPSHRFTGTHHRIRLCLSWLRFITPPERIQDRFRPSSLPHRQLRNYTVMCPCETMGSLPHRQLRKTQAGQLCAAIGSLPHRQLRKNFAAVYALNASSLPHRQLRKSWRAGFSYFCCSLPHRQLRKFLRD